jgi:multidrug efflux system outer membrane protein
LIVSIFMRVAVALVGGVLLTSCTLGPNYKRPVVATPSAHRGASAAEGVSPESLADLKWFELFSDETLTGLVTAALKQNFELRIAAERVLQARAAYGITRADRFPEVGASAGVNAVRSSQTGANRAIPQGADTDVSYTQAGFSLGWELDVWGRLRRLSEAARAQYLAQEARRGVITTLVADVSETYLVCARWIWSSRSPGAHAIATESLRLTDARRAGGRRRPRRPTGGATALHRDGGDRQPRARDRPSRERSAPPPGQLPGTRRGRPLEAFQAPPSVPAGIVGSWSDGRTSTREQSLSPPTRK